MLSLTETWPAINVTSIELPNSKIEVSLTKKFWPTSWKEDNRISIQPNILIDYSFTDYSAKVDPWLQAIIQYETTEQKKSNFSIETLSGIPGNHSIGGRKLEFYQEDGQLFAKMGRKMMSLFEFHTQVYPDTLGRLSTDIEGLYFTYSTSSKEKISILDLEWSGIISSLNSQ